ncbi:spore germination protein [Paenibacillus glycanilyticus]|uniref:spore germination protein n=1 Tax=Paenibacillus glycanilyticus TaxID=126569 RepID=UPI0035A21B3D
MSTNLGLVRARLKTSKLKTESVTLGELSHTQIVMTYLEGIADGKVIEQVRSRLRSIRIDGVLDSGSIEEFIEDQPYSPFPQVHSTERPDVVAADKTAHHPDRHGQGFQSLKAAFYPDILDDA